MNPYAEVAAAFDAYAATKGKPLDEQEAARLKYDAAVRRHEKRFGCDVILSLRDRMEMHRRAEQPAVPPRRSAWDPEPR